MAIRGRRPKPVELHLIEGTFKPSRHRQAAASVNATPVGRLTDPPDWFSPEQMKLWNEAVGFSPNGLLTKRDWSTLANWVVACDLHRQACLQLASGPASGLVHTTSNGTMIQSPLVGTINKQAMIMLKAAAELGFTPSSRSRVTVDEDASKADPEAEFFGT
jgi:P27 family predicted phage terminase small subunit